MGVPYAEVSCFDDSVSADVLLGPLLNRALDADQMATLVKGSGLVLSSQTTTPGRSPRRASSSNSPTSITLGMVYVLEVTKRKDLLWSMRFAEIKRDLLLLHAVDTPSAMESSSASKEDKSTLRKSLLTLRRRSVARTSATSSPSSSPPAGRLLESDATSAPKTVLLQDCKVQSRGDATAEGRFPFAIVDVAGVVHSFEVESSGKRDEWVAAISALQGGSSAVPSPVVNDDPLSGNRRRGRTFNASTSNSGTLRKLFQNE